MSTDSSDSRYTPGSWHWPDENSSEPPQSFPSHPRPEPFNTSPPKSSEQSTPRSQRPRRWRPRTCRICLETVYPTFDTDSGGAAFFSFEPEVKYESEGGRLIRPCKCNGTSRYVHESCLEQWRHADPSYGRKNYLECPTCRYKYKLERMDWGRWVQSQAMQIGLTLLIFIVTIFLLGFVADPIINLYFDPFSTIASAGRDAFHETHILDEDEDPSGWIEHFMKGIASLGLMGCAKMLFTLGPWNWYNLRNHLGGGGRAGGTGRDRINSFTWIAIILGIVTFLYAVWKAVRRWSRRFLEKASERVIDVQGDDEDDETTNTKKSETAPTDDVGAT